MLTTSNVAVVGSGLGGLAAACTLAARGHRVTLFERNDWTGGKAAVLEAQGFRFDMGPTIVTLPEVIERIFAEANLRISDRLEMVRLDPQWGCFFSDGSRLNLLENVDAMANALDAYSPGTAAGQGYRRLLELSKAMHEVTDRYFFWKPVGSIRDTLRISGMFNPAVLADLRAMRLGSTVAATIRSYVRDHRAAQMLDHLTQYVGSWPDRCPAILCAIAHMQTDRGIWYPMGGTRAIPVALAKLAEELGVAIRTGCPITGIARDASGAMLTTRSGEQLRFDRCISNADCVRTFRDLIGGSVGADFLRSRPFEPACSGVVLYLGLDRSYDHLQHHNFVFSRDPDEEFEAIYDKGQPAPDPTCYVCAPARTEPAVAPPNGEALYVLVHTPYLRPEHDWSRMLPEYRSTMLRKLATTGGMPDIEERIVFEAALTPEDIDRRYAVLQGAIYGLASHGRWTGAFKPNNRSNFLPGLYLAGGSVHPGPGMPMALMSGWIAADALDRDLKG